MEGRDKHSSSRGGRGSKLHRTIIYNVRDVVHMSTSCISACLCSMELATGWDCVLSLAFL